MQGGVFVHFLKEPIRTGISGSGDRLNVIIRVNEEWVFTSSDITAFPVLTKTCGGSNKGFAAGRAVCGELRCEIPNYDYPRGAKVELFLGADTPPVGIFYIYERRIRGNRVELRAKDVISLADIPFEPAEGESVTTVNLLLDSIGERLGVNISNVDNNYDIPENTPLKGSIRDMLGYCAASQGLNAFAELGVIWVKPPVSDDTVEIDVSDHSPVEIRSLFCGDIGRVRLKKIDCRVPSEFRTVTVRKDGAVSERLQTLEDFGIYESGTSGRTVELVVPFASEEMADNLAVSLADKGFGSAFYCKVCRLSEIPRIADRVVFSEIAGEKFYVSEMSVKFTGRGIFATLSSEGDRETEGRYYTREERSLLQKAEMDCSFGGVEICSDGEIRTEVNGSDTAVSFGGGVLSVYALEAGNEQS